jgi:putative ATP-dependent endonuclease of the OLD family
VDVDPKVNAQLRYAIRQTIKDLKLEICELPLDAEGAKQIWEQLKKHLPIFALFKSDRPSTDQDEEAQDPMKLAVKEALKLKESALNEITEHVRIEVERIAQETVKKIQDMDPTLASQLKPRFIPPKWDSIFKITLTGDEDIPINKRGSGVRRLVLLNFFRAKAEQRVQEKEISSVIYAIEEPETSQHPNNQKMILNALSELAEQANYQVIITTHTPMLARILPVESIRYIEIGADNKRIICTQNDEMKIKVIKALGVLPDHDVKLFVGVEGPNDINFLKTISRKLKQSGEDVPDLFELEASRKLVFIPLGGSNLGQWVARLNGLNIPEFHLFDRSVDSSKVSPYQEVADKMNALPNCKAAITGKIEIENYLHPEAIRLAKGITVSFGDFDDVPMLVAQAMHDASGVGTAWNTLEEKKQRSKISRAKAWLNKEATATMTVEMLKESDPQGHLKTWLGEMKIV